MNQEQVQGLLRDLGKYIALWIAAHGYLDAMTAQFVGGLVVAAGLTAWSYWTNRTANLISAAAKSDDVTKIVTTKEIAKADPNPKVVSETHHAS